MKGGLKIGFQVWGGMWLPQTSTHVPVFADESFETRTPRGLPSAKLQMGGRDGGKDHVVSSRKKRANSNAVGSD